MFREYPVTSILVNLFKDSLLPAILFRSSRRQCDVDIETLGERRSIDLLPRERQQLVEQVEAVIAKYDLPEDIIKGHPQYQVLLSKAAGAHHAGQLLMWRLLLEELMSRGVLRLLVATGTVAAGVDFPARTVIITAHSKRGSGGFNVLTSAEFQQMSGRAGRRGKDAVGICLVAPSQFCDARVIHEVAKRPAEPLRSAYFAAPATVLNLLKFRSPLDLRHTVELSLAAFLDKKAADGLRKEAAKQEAELDKDLKAGKEYRKKAQKRVNRLLREAEVLEGRQVELLDQSLRALDQLGYIEDARLTNKGFWAAELCTSLVLELAEAIDAGLFEELSVIELVAMVGSISGDPHRTYLAIRKNPIKKESFEKFQKIVSYVKEHYQSPSNENVEVLPNAALTVITWLEAQDWPQFASLLRLGGVAEGDAARVITQTADHLNQISRLVKSHPDLALLAEEGRRSLLRPPLLETLALDDGR